MLLQPCFYWFRWHHPLITQLSLQRWTHLSSKIVYCRFSHQREFLSEIGTLYNAILRIARNFLETRENIKISTHPFYHINLGWFSWEWSKKKFFFSKKINSKWPTQKNWVFQPPLKAEQFSPKFHNFWRWLKNSVFLNQPFWIFFFQKKIFFASFLSKLVTN